MHSYLIKINVASNKFCIILIMLLNVLKYIDRYFFLYFEYNHDVNLNLQISQVSKSENC